MFDSFNAAGLERRITDAQRSVHRQTAVRGRLYRRDPIKGLLHGAVAFVGVAALVAGGSYLVNASAQRYQTQSLDDPAPAVRILGERGVDGYADPTPDVPAPDSLHELVLPSDSLYIRD